MPLFSFLYGNIMLLKCLFIYSGTCQCDAGYGASDCSVDIKIPPRLVGVLEEGFCDENETDCTHIYVFGETFFGTNISCRLRKFTVSFCLKSAIVPF